MLAYADSDAGLDCGMIYAANGFRPISRISHLFLTSYYWLTNSGIKLGETAVSNMLEKLGRRDDEAKGKPLEKVLRY